MPTDVNDLRAIAAKAFTDFEITESKLIEDQVNIIIELCRTTALKGEYSTLYKLDGSYLLTQAIMAKLIALGLKVKLSVLELTISWE